MGQRNISEVTVPGADAAVSIAEELSNLGYKELSEGEDLHPGSYEFWSGEDENGSECSGVRFIELPQHEGLAERLIPRDELDWKDE